MYRYFVLLCALGLSNQCCFPPEWEAHENIIVATKGSGKITPTIMKVSNSIFKSNNRVLRLKSNLSKLLKPVFFLTLLFICNVSSIFYCSIVSVVVHVVIKSLSHSKDCQIVFQSTMRISWDSPMRRYAVTGVSSTNGVVNNFRSLSDYISVSVLSFCSFIFNVFSSICTTISFDSGVSNRISHLKNQLVLFLQYNSGQAHELELGEIQK